MVVSLIVPVLVSPKPLELLIKKCQIVITVKNDITKPAVSTHL